MSYISKLKRRARNEDKALFTKWMNRQITTDRAIEEFMINNHMKDVIINVNEFEAWLNGLGYKRSRI